MTTTNADLSYGGGPVMHQTTTYLIYWVPTGYEISDLEAVSLEKQFLTDLGGPFYDLLSQYYDVNADGYRVNIQPQTHFGGVWTDTDTSYPAEPGMSPGSESNPVSDADVQAEVKRAIAANPQWNGPGLSTLYEVFLGDNIQFCENDHNCSFGDSTRHISGICAYHGAFSQSGDTVIYANDGNQQNRSGCGTPTDPNDATADADVSIMSHETFEAITNPVGQGWYGPKAEIGDACRTAWGKSVAADGANLMMTGHPYEVQEEWSNLKHGCDLPSGAMESGVTRAAYPACTAQTLPPNDDGSTGRVSLPFTVDFFSKSFDSLWVNNNGNVTFDGPQSTYTPYGLKSTSHEIIAPFFADVDTRGSVPYPYGAQKVTYGGSAAGWGQPAYFCVDWTNVGYYGDETDKLNSFQLLLIDRSATTGHAGDFDIEFNYDKIQWETGDASYGYDGLGGDPAVVGYSNGSTRSLELPGSGGSGAFEDDGYYALTQGDLDSTTPGQYIFHVSNGDTPTGGSIHGTVADELHGAVISGVPVQICGETTGTCALTQTNSDGIYAVAALEPDVYDITVNPPWGSALTSGSGSATVTAGSNVVADIGLEAFLPFDPLFGNRAVGITFHRLNDEGSPILDWLTTNTIYYDGCANGTVSATIALNDGSGEKTLDLQPSIFGRPGDYSATIPAFYPSHGPATVTVTASCPDPSQNLHESFTVYIDPSGVVVDQDGNPVANATVTLLRSNAATGPFTPVPDGSALMSPGNRANPDTTTTDGTFGWDVLTGYYEVQASKNGCADPADPTSATVTSPVFRVPPPMTNLRLVLDCAGDPTTLTYTGPSAGDTHDPTTTSAVLTDQATGQPVPHQTVIITFADQTCTAVTDTTGTATCTVTPQAPAGAATARASFAGTASYQPSNSNLVAITLRPDESTLTLATPTALADGMRATLTATLTEDGQTALAAEPVTLTLGSGPNLQACTTITGTDGVASCDITVDQPLGPTPITAAFAGDEYDQPADAAASTIVFAYLPTGAFVTSDGNASVGDTVTLWSPQWCAQNGATPCPPAFKGYASSTGPAPYNDGGSWTASPGASSNPPNTVPTYMAVLTTTAVTKKGSTISGTITHVIIVEIDPTTVSPGVPLVGQVVAALS